MSATRNDLPPVVETDLTSIGRALVDLGTDLRRLGLGLQEERAFQIWKAVDRLKTTATGFASPND